MTMLHEARNEAGAEGRSRIASARSASGEEYFYVEGEVRVREGQQAWAEEALHAHGIEHGPATPPLGGYHTLEVANIDVPEAVRVLRRNGVSAQPHYAVTLAVHGQFQPYDAPSVIREGDPLWNKRNKVKRRLQKATGDGAKVVVIDTGIVKKHLAPAIHQGKAIQFADDDPLADPKGGTIPHYSAHGTFVAGRIIARNRRAALYVFRPREFEDEYRGRLVFSDTSLAATLARSLRYMADGTDLGSIARDQIVSKAENAATMLHAEPARIPAVLNLSLTAYAHGNPADSNGADLDDPDDDPTNPLPLTKATLDIWLGLGTKVVAAAGNEASTKERFPAAYPGVIAVGARDRNGLRAPFSNHGPWVDVFRMGVNAVSAYLDADGTVSVPHDIPVTSPYHKTTTGGWDGYAAWSGTSFAAPNETGYISKQHN